jgi:hypothetical protein
MSDQRPTEVYDWAADFPLGEQQLSNPPAVYASSAPVQVPPNVHVMAAPGQTPYYAYAPAPLPPYDPRPALMYGCGVMAFGIGAGVGIVEVGSYVMFAGMALATHAIIGIAAAFVSGAVAVVALRMSGGVRIGSFHQGDNSSFQAGGRR